MSDSGDSGVACLLITGDDQPLDFSKKSSTNSTSKKEGTSLLSSSNHQQGRKATSLNNLIQTIANNNSSSHDGRRDDRHHVFTTPSPSPPDGSSVSSLSSPSLASHSLLTTLPGLASVTAPPSKEGANSTTANLSQLMSTAAAIAAAAASNGQGINSPHFSLNGQAAIQTPSSSSTARSSSHTRPFKAYSTTPASGLAGYYGLPMSPEAAIMAAASEQAYLQFRQQMLSQKQEMKQKTHRSSHNGNNNLSDDNSSNCSFDTTTNGSGNGGTPLLQQQPSSSPLANNAISQQSLTHQSPPTPTGPSISSLTQNGRKRGRPLPNDVKDEAYWERRRKNNEAAKRGRDARRAKEDEIAIRAAFLETENMKLRLEVAALKQELTKLVSQIQ